MPTAYAKLTLRAARQELRNETSVIEQLPSSPQSSQPRDTLLHHLKSLDQIVGQMAQTVEREERPAMARSLERLAKDEQAIRSLMRTAEPPT